MIKKQLKLDNGKTIYLSFEDGTSDEDIEKALQLRKNKDDVTSKITQYKDSGSFGTDLKRIALDTQRDIVRLGDDFIPGDTFGLDKLEGYEKERRLSQLAEFGYLDSKGQIDSSTGKIKELDTYGGMAASFVPYLVGGGLAYKALSKVGSIMGGSRLASSSFGKFMGKDIVKGTVAGVAVEQAFTDPDENLFNVVSEVFPEKTQGTVFEALSADKDDSTASKRLKLAIGDAGLGAVIEGVTTILPIAYKAAKAKSPGKGGDTVDTAIETLRIAMQSSKRKNIEELKKSFDLNADTTDYDLLNLKNPERKEIFSETPESLKQIENQRTDLSGSSFVNSLSKLNQKFLTSRGFLTQNLNNIFNESQARQAKIIAESTLIGNRLTKSLKKIKDSSLREKETVKTQDLLTTDLSYLNELDFKDKILTLSAKENISVTTAEAIIDGRGLINDLSTLLYNSKGFTKEARASIQNNFGVYLKKSYRLFEDNNFEINDNLFNEAVQERVDALKQIAIDSGKTIEEIDEKNLFNRATLQLQKLIDKGNKENIDYFTQVKRVSKIYKKGDVPPKLSALLGEITDPSENLILSATKAARLYEVNNFYNQMFEVASNTKVADRFILGRNTKAAVKRGLNNEANVIKGTNSRLDGKVTTPEMLAFLERREDIIPFLLDSNNITNAPYKAFLKYKGLAQYSKTILSHTTLLRNIMGGMQFGLANGDFSGVNPVQWYKKAGVIRNNIWKLGDKELDNYYLKLIDLGIVNTNVNVNLQRELLSLETGKSSSKAAEFLTDNRVSKKAEEYYVGWDDYFKMSNYEHELSWQKKAFPDQDIKVLEQKAANIVKDTFPNYARVSKGVKAINYLPVGNFVSFPAEMIRTSINIVKQASEELTSGNSVLRNRGIYRLGGFTAAVGAFGVAARTSANLMGWDTEEAEAHNKMAEGKYNKNANNIWYRDDQGDVGFISTKYLDSYATIKLPVVAVMNRIVQGELKGEQLDDYLLKAVGTGVYSTIEPFVGASIATKQIADVFNAINSEDGRTSDGRLLIPPSLDISEKAAVVTSELWKAVEPGTITTARRTAGSSINKFTGEENTSTKFGIENEILSNSGVRFTKFDPKLQLSFAVRSYKKKFRNNIRSTYKAGEDTGLTILDDYISRQSRNYEYQQELFLLADAFSSMYSERETLKELTNNGLSKPEAMFIIRGTFKPVKPPQIDSKISKIIEASGENNSQYRIRKEYDKAYKTFQKLTLIGGGEEFNPFTISDETEERLSFKTGGEVDVPNASDEPDERIDKYTGEPYNEMAGEAYQDEEEDPLSRLGFGRGGYAKGGIPSSASEAMMMLAEHYGVTEEMMFENQNEAAALINQAVKESLIDKREAVPVDKKGSIKERANVGEAFNAINHAILTSKYPEHKGKLTIKEYAQMLPQGFEDSKVDLYNNEVGYTLSGLPIEERNRALLNKVAERTKKLNTGVPLEKGDLIFNYDESPISTKLRSLPILGKLYEKEDAYNKKIAERQNKNKGGKVYNSLKRNCS